MVDAVDRLEITGPWKRIDAYTIANDLTDLTDSTLDTSLHQFENGTYLTEECATTFACRTWTGTNADGTGAAATCDDWTDALGGFQGMKGSAADGPLTSIWSNFGTTGGSLTAWRRTSSPTRATTTTPRRAAGSGRVGP